MGFLSLKFTSSFVKMLMIFFVVFYIFFLFFLLHSYGWFGILRGYNSWENVVYRFKSVIDKPLRDYVNDNYFTEFDEVMGNFVNPEMDIEGFRNYITREAESNELIDGGFIWRRGIDTLELVSVKTELNEETLSALKTLIDSTYRQTRHKGGREPKGYWKKIAALNDSLREIIGIQTGYSLYNYEYFDNPDFAAGAVNEVFGIIWDTQSFVNTYVKDINEVIENRYYLGYKDPDDRWMRHIGGILIIDSKDDTLISKGYVETKKEIWNYDYFDYNSKKANRLERFPGLYLYIQDWSNSDYDISEFGPKFKLGDTSFFRPDMMIWRSKGLYISLSFPIIILLLIIIIGIHNRNRQRDFMAQAAHELRTPAAKVRLFAETLRNERTVSPEKETEYLNTIMLESDHLSVLIDNTLNLIRFDTDRMKFNKTAVETSKWLSEFAESQRSYMINSGFEYIVNIEDNLPKVKIDGELMKLALRNIMDNAVKYSIDNKRVAIYGKLSSGKIYISIEDTGIGIPANKRRKVFRRYFRVKRTDIKHVPGTGMGLSLVKQIIAGHKGKVRIDAEYQNGTKVNVELKAE